MAGLSTLLRRYSCRRFAETSLDETEIFRLLEAARWAPSAGNVQPWRFVAVTSSRLRRGLARSAGQKFVAVAPLVIAVCAVPEESSRRYGERGNSLYVLQDTAAATQNILLAAAEMGLGSCWVGAFDEASAAAALALPTGWRPVALVPVGHPLEGPPQRERRPLEEIARFLAD